MFLRECISVRSSREYFNSAVLSLFPLIKRSGLSRRHFSYADNNIATIRRSFGGALTAMVT
jgi:hypothetical protein